MDEVKKIPNHIAVIMDGNRRWAKKHKLPSIEGHRRVADVVLEKLISHAADVGVRYLTLWAWSTENWSRTNDEVTGIMKLLKWGFGTYGMRMHKKGIRVKVIGNIAEFAADIRKPVTDLVELTKNNSRITVTFALNYGGRDEIIRAVRRVPADQIQNISAAQFSNLLDTEGVPDPELIIRPGGEKRLSGFLLWQSEYSELYFTDWYMPDFTPERLDEAIAEFQNRMRRFGK